MNEPQRVLHVIGKMDRGGAETMLMNLYRNIDRKVIQFDFVVHTTQKGEYDDEILKLGGKIYYVPAYKIINLVSYSLSWKRFFSKHRDYLAVHGHIGSSAPIYLSIAKRFHFKTIAHSHATNSPILKLKIQYALLAFPVRFVAKFFLAPTIQAGQDRFGLRVVNGQNFFILKNAIQSEDFLYKEDIRKQMRTSLNLSENFVVGHVGRLTLAKNHTFLLDVFADVLKTKTNAKLLLVGIGELEEEVRNKVKSMNLEEEVIFLGLRDDVPKIMQAMDVFLFPSLWEGLGLVVIEAQASGLNCIVSDSLPKDVDIDAGSISFLSLSASISQWSKEVLLAENTTRSSKIEEVIKSGYDIQTTTKWLTEFYLNL